MKKILAAALALFCLLIPFGCNDPIQNPPEPEKPTTYQNSLIDRKDGLHILAVGNSFTYVSTTYLWEIMNDLGFTNVKVARLYIGGTTIRQHAANFSTNTSYSFDTNSNGKWRKAAMSAKNAVMSDSWDVVTLQQQSADAGNASTYDEEDFDLIIHYLSQWNEKSDYTLAWMMNWAYETDCTYSYFAQYNYDQQYMYDCIVNATIEKIVPNQNFRQILPLGTAVQNARTGQLGDCLTMDGYHLNELGDYIAGVCWVKAMTNCDLSSLDWVPEILSEYENLPEIARECAERAVNEMFVPHGY